MSYGATSWTTTGVSHWTKGTYPRVSFLPNGKLFVASPADSDRTNYIFDPATNTLTQAGTDVVPESEPNDVHCCESWRGTGTLLPFVPSGGAYPHFQFALINGVNAYVHCSQLSHRSQRPAKAKTRTRSVVAACFDLLRH